MEDNEIFVENSTENTEVTAEETTAQPEKTYTQAELDDILKKRLARNTAKITKDFERKYSNAEYLQNVVKAGLETDDIEEATDTLANFYSERGKTIPKRQKESQYSNKDIDILAKAEAEEIIRAGYEDVVDEVDRLTEIGVENMTPREKAVFKVLAEHRQSTERKNELNSIGVTDDVLNSQEFKDFAKKFNSDTPIKDVWNIYKQTLPKKEFKTMGSMKSTETKAVKDFYTPEEIARLTEDDLKDPNVWNTVRRSMTGS